MTDSAVVLLFSLCNFVYYEYDVWEASFRKNVSTSPTFLNIDNLTCVAALRYAICETLAVLQVYESQIHPVER